MDERRRIRGDVITAEAGAPLSGPTAGYTSAEVDPQETDMVPWSEERPRRILVFTTLYPSAARPVHGIFVENRLRHLLAGGGIEARVLAPVPWFPSGQERFGEYGAFARTPRDELRCGIPVAHPRFPVVPKLGMSAAPALLYTWMRPVVRRLIRSGFDFDLLDAHYFYPDGVAAAMLARTFGKPLTITARGTDLNLIPEYALPRRMVCWAANRADGLITVCQALKDTLVDLGIADERVHVLRNGVDLAQFRPFDRDKALHDLGLTGPLMVSVGGLITRKRHDLAIRALHQLPDMTLAIAGEGPEDGALRRLCTSLGLAQRVHFLGRVAHDALARVYSAASVLILASSREGWPNVLLEAMACGTPAIATRVWGAPEVIQAPEAGRLVDEATPEAIASAVQDVLANPPAPGATRAYAERFSWNATSEGQRKLFASILAHRR